MHGLDGFLTDLAVVLCVAALSSVVFQRLRQPVVLGYLLAGFLIGPHIAQPIVARHETVHTLSELGVILLMFSLGLEFSVRRLLKLGGRAGLVTVLDVSLMLWLGFLTGRAFGWSVSESLFAGALVAISSTMIVARTFTEQRVERGLKDLVYGVLIFEDLLAILLVAMLSAVAQGASLSAGDMAYAVLRLTTFLLVLVVIGFLCVPRFLRFVVRGGNRETLLLATVGTSFAFALIAKGFGYSVALGAFVAGSLAAESGEARMLERLVRPMRDIFAAIFFVSVGMMIDPTLIARHAGAILAFTVVVLVGKTLGISAAAMATGNGAKNSLRAGMSLAQIGEFSFLIAGIGIGLGSDSSFLFPVAVGVSVLTTFTTPWMVSLSRPLAEHIGTLLPRRLRDFATLYESWLQRLGQELVASRERARLRRTFGLALVDALLFTGILIGTSLAQPTLARIAQRWLPIHLDEAHLGIVVLGGLLALPFLVGLLRCVRQLGLLMASEVLPEAEEGGLDLGAAPRRALVVGLQLAGLVLFGLPVLALTQPFLPALPGVGAFIAVFLFVIAFFWYGATKLDGQMKAGAQMILELLARQSRGPNHHGNSALRELLPKAEGLTSVPIAAGAPSVGRTLAQLDLRGRTGATVVCIQRGPHALVFPSAGDALCAGDVLFLDGEEQGVEAARRMLEAGVGDLRRVG